MHFKGLRFLFTNSFYLVVVVFCCFFFHFVSGQNLKFTRALSNYVVRAIFIHSTKERKKEKRRERDASRGKPHRGDDVAHNKATRFRVCARDDVVYSIARMRDSPNVPKPPSNDSERPIVALGGIRCDRRERFFRFKRTRRALRGRFKRIRRHPKGKFATISRVCEERKNTPGGRTSRPRGRFLAQPEIVFERAPGGGTEHFGRVCE